MARLETWKTDKLKLPVIDEWFTISELSMVSTEITYSSYYSYWLTLL